MKLCMQYGDISFINAFEIRKPKMACAGRFRLQ